MSEWKAMPKYPTERMIQAAQKTTSAAFTKKHVIEVYEAMRDNSPTGGLNDHEIAEIQIYELHKSNSAYAEANTQILSALKRIIENAQKFANCVRHTSHSLHGDDFVKVVSGLSDFDKEIRKCRELSE